MKKIISIVSVSIIALFCNLAIAQEKTTLENTTLWKVEHKDLKEPSYLFGTLHMMCEEDFSFHSKVTETLNKVGEIVFEINLSDPKEIQVLQSMMSNTEKISEQISAEKFTKLDSLIQEKIGVPLTQLDQYGLSNINLMLFPKMLPCEKIKSLEVELIQLATVNKISISALETATEQMDFLNKAYPVDFTYKQLMLFDSYKKDFNDAIQEYKNENITKAVALLSKEQYMNENAEKWLLTVRNKNWIKKMPKMMQEKSNLFAIGAAHLLNKNGIIHLLRQKGYTVTPILN